jgi:hypothetical protein
MANGGQKSAPVALIEVFGKTFWPFVLLLVIFIFHDEIGAIFESANKQIMNAASTDIKGIIISLPKKDLPEPSEIVKKILPQLDEKSMKYMVDNPGEANTTATICNLDNSERVALDKLSKIQLIKLRINDKNDLKKYADQNHGEGCKKLFSYIEFDPTMLIGLTPKTTIS